MLLAIATFIFGLFNLLISIEVLNPKYRHAFSITAMALSSIPIILQCSIFLGELMRCDWWFKLIINRFFTTLLGDYGRDLLLSISIYSGLTEDAFKKKFYSRGKAWKFFVWVLFRISKVLKWVVFSDPFSGLFQTRYKSTVVWMAKRGEGNERKGANYDHYYNKAREDLSVVFFEESMTIRGVIVAFRKFDAGDDKDTIDMTYYSSQSTSVAGLFHDIQGPFDFSKGDLEKACRMLVVLRILKNDSFFVEPPYDDTTEPVLNCTSIKDMVDLVMDTDKDVNYDMVTGAKYGGVKKANSTARTSFSKFIGRYLVKIKDYLKQKWNVLVAS